MPTKKKPEPPWQVILEEIRSQNRATIEAVEVNRESLEQQIEQLRRETGVRLETLELAIGASREAIDGNRDAIEGVRERVEQVERTMAARLHALEEMLGRIDQESRSRDASLDVAIRDLKVSVQQNSVDLRELATKFVALTRLEERVAALERRSA
jgi:hypothetical protein